MRDLHPDYRIVRELPSAFGRAYEAERRSTGQIVRLRRFAVPGLSSEERSSLDGELRESCARAALVTTPRVVRVHELAGAPGGGWVLVTDHMEGPSLVDLRPYDDPDFNGAMLSYVAKGLAEALRDMHRAGVAHGCVMPGWVLADHEGFVRLDGLGLAPVLARTKRKSSRSPAHGSRRKRSRRPEVDWYRLQPHTEDLPGQERDIFQVAVILSYCVTGKLPLGGEGTSPAASGEFAKWLHRLSLN